jgi:hypothetical protein
LTESEEEETIIINREHGQAAAVGQLRSSAGWVKFPPKRTLVLLDAGTYLLGAKCRAFLREQRQL